jgi:hypothetical protein
MPRLSLGLGVQAIRKVGGGAAFSPANLSSLSLWLKADAGITASGSNVTAWADQSGNGNNATMYNNPQLIANALNSKPVISFNGSTNYGSFPISLTGGTPRTIFIVGKYNDINRGQEGFIALGDSETFDLGYVFRDNESQQTNYYVNYNFNQNQAAAPQLTSVANYHIATVNHSSGSDSNMGINGVFGANTTLDNLSTTQGVIAVRNTNPDEYASINIAEIIIYNRALTTPERQQVEAYLNTKYAIY